MGQSFHVYPSSAQTVDQAPNYYSRATPLMADIIEACSIPAAIGHYDASQFCYVACVAQKVRFNAHILFQAPRSGSIINVWFMKNVLPPPDGSPDGEMCGADVMVYQQLGATPVNQSCSVERIMTLAAGDKVWCVPGNAGGGQLTNAVASNGNNTVNYFEGEVIELL